jgi:hypothetical protein
MVVSAVGADPEIRFKVGEKERLLAVHALHKV